MAESTKTKKFTLPASRLFDLTVSLQKGGYTVIGPRIENEVVTLAEYEKGYSLPSGYTDEQSGGTYRLHYNGEKNFFDFVVGPHSAKRILQPPRERLFETANDSGSIAIRVPALPARKVAFFGLRPCDVAAIQVLDRVLASDDFVDENYCRRRSATLLIVVNCARPGGSCFCASMGSGPRARAGFDLSLSEVAGPECHDFLLEVGSQVAAEVIESLDLEEASEALCARVDMMLENAAHSMGRELDTQGVVELFKRNYESSYWDQLGDRCLSCANCTLVCPTCFCTNIEDTTDLSGKRARRERRWDSCFGIEFSFIHGGSVRTSTSSRYRHWITHKLATWHDQYGMSGCVGCGRCITWCPVGIDITEETAAIRKRELQSRTGKLEVVG